MDTLHKKPKNQKRLILLVLLALVLAGIFGYGGYRLYQKWRTHTTPQVATPAENAPKVDYSPPTKEDKKAVDQHKEDLSKDQQQSTTPQTPTTGLKSVTPVVITAVYSKSSQTLDVRAFVPGVVENGGTCTLKVTKDSAVITTKDSKATANASTTDCTPFKATGLALESGAKAVISYTSSTSQGSSQERTIDIQ